MIFMQPCFRIPDAVKHYPKQQLQKQKSAITFDLFTYKNAIARNHNHIHKPSTRGNVNLEEDQFPHNWHLLLFPSTCKQ
jgi:hypothetical protein